VFIAGGNSAPLLPPTSNSDLNEISEVLHGHSPYSNDSTALLRVMASMGFSAMVSAALAAGINSQHPHNAVQSENTY
jgi:hypothetical protein